ncbi:hypothetical protein [Saccharothrix syringae]|nr:hypothetical protein [Saccharothrix syringae]
MAKHRLVQSDDRQWGGPDLVTGIASAPVPVEAEQVDAAAEQVERD